MNDNFSTVGDIYSDGQHRAIKTLVSVAGALVYVAGIMYAEVHGYSMLVKGVDPDMLLWAIVGMFALGVTALALPLGLHSAFFDHTQRLVALMFYALDLVLLFLNAAIDFAMQTGTDLAGWSTLYYSWVVPSSPIIVACGWSLVSLLDPSQKMRSMVETLKASTKQALALRVADAARSTDIGESVDLAAQELARSVIRETLGVSAAYSQLPSKAQPEKVHPQPARSVTTTNLVPAFKPNGNGSSARVYEQEVDGLPNSISGQEE